VNLRTGFEAYLEDRWWIPRTICNAPGVCGWLLNVGPRNVYIATSRRPQV